MKDINSIKILYEISMSIGTSLNIENSIQDFSDTILNKLDCTNIWIAKYYHKDYIYSNPKESTEYLDFLEDILGYRTDYLTILETMQKHYYSNIHNGYWYIFDIKDFGVLIFRKEQKLEDSMLSSLEPIMLKISNSVKSSLAVDLINLQKEKLKESLQRAKSAEETKSRFLATMSHEIRTPLNGVIGFASLLKETSLDKKQLDFVNTIDSSSHTLLNIINDILDYSKIEAGQLSLETINIDCTNILKMATSMFDVQAKQKGIEFIFVTDENMPQCIVCDPVRLKQIVTNLVSNAIKFTSNGKVVLSIKHIQYQGDDAILNISVKDTGIGISPENLKNIFEPFAQSDSSTTRKYGGTGLGLSITKQLVSLLDSELEVTSTIGEGSEFFFTFHRKICKKLDDSCQIEFEDPITIQNSVKVLLVEDNKINQKLMSFILESEDMQYTIVSNGQDAIDEYIKDSSYFMIFMDINMPIMDGMEATKKIIEYEKKSLIEHTPIIALTANAIKGDKDKYINIGMDDYLSKPINRDKLKQIIKNAHKRKEIL